MAQDNWQPRRGDNGAGDGRLRGMEMRKNLAVLALATGLIASPSFAADDDPPATPPIIQQLYDCRAITDPTARLACFDQQVAALATAEQAHDVRIVDRAQVRETRRGLFGFSINLGNIFGGGDDDEAAANEEGVNSLTATITSVGTDASGHRLFILDNDQHWVQTDGSSGRSPRAGMSIVISRGALGSFVARINDRPGVRVMRVR